MKVTIKFYYKWLLASFTCLFFTACKPDAVVVVDEKRSLSSMDNKTIFIVDVPPGWRNVIEDVPANQIAPRMLTMRVGKETEAYLSESNIGGGVLPNVNRWYRQMGKEQIDDLSSLKRIDFWGLNNAYYISLDGVLDGKFENWSMRVALIVSSSNIITFKFVGPQDEVAKHEEAFLQICKTLELREERDARLKKEGSEKVESKDEGQEVEK